MPLSAVVLLFIHRMESCWKIG